MKKNVLLLFVFLAYFLSVSAQSWQFNTYGMYLSPLNTKLGIGLSNPTQALSVRGNMSVTPVGITPEEHYTGNIMLTRSVNGGQFINMVRQGQYSWSIGTLYNSSVLAIGPGRGSDAEFTNAFFTLDMGGQVGIGVNNPKTKLHVDGSVLIPYGASYWIGNAADSGNRLRLHHNGNEAFIDYSLDLYIRAGTKYVLTLDQNGTVRVPNLLLAKEIKVQPNIWSDFVFNDNYNLRSIKEVETFIKNNKHLPDVPKESDVINEGINLAEMDAILLRKIEETMLYIIELKNENEILKNEIENLKNKR